MVFKRREKRSYLKSALEFIYPRGGWARAFEYVKHRLRRLPDPPEKIARGIWAGVFTAFTPFYGLHFIVAALLAKLMRGNILAALLATFFGNPLTYLPIAVASLGTGRFIFGAPPQQPGEAHTIGGKFVNAGRDLWDNLIALFTSEKSDWTRLGVFFDDIFLPYLVGGIVPGVIAASICYYLVVPVIRVYQNRRKGRIKAKFLALRKKTSEEADEPIDKA